MVSPENHRWHCDYVRLAWDAGFSFGSHDPSGFDKNSLVLLDVEHVVRERDIASVERHISTVLRYSLDQSSTGLLDSTFVKVFRLAQLAIDYLLFCKRYLDGCVAALKSDCAAQRDEIGELKRRLEELESRPNLTTFKCERCPKHFSSSEYLDSHVRRRHESTDHLHSEIKELKERLNVAERSLVEKAAPDVYDKFDEFKRRVEEEVQAIRARNEKLNGEKKESVHTQTEREPQARRRLVKTTVQNINITDDGRGGEDKIGEIRNDIDAKISSGLLGIQRQLEDFSEKLKSLEPHRLADAPQNLVVIPQPTPRTKLPTPARRTSVEPKAETIEPDEVKSEEGAVIEPDEVKPGGDRTVIEPDSPGGPRKTVDYVEPDLPEVKLVRVPQRTPQRRAHRTTVERPKSEEVVVISPVKSSDRRRVERKRLPLSVSVNNILDLRSETVGCLKSLSEKTLRKALSIIGRPVQKRKVVKVRYRRSSKENESPQNVTPIITIKNRSLYDTTDSEREPKKCLRYYPDSDLTTAASTDEDEEGKEHIVQVKEKKKKVLFDVRRIVESSSD